MSWPDDDHAGKCPKCHCDPCVCAEIARTFKADAIRLSPARNRLPGRYSVERALRELDRESGAGALPWDV
jgi:hypothetical protein